MSIGAGRVDWGTESTGRTAYLFVNLTPAMMILRLTIAEDLAADRDVEETLEGGILGDDDTMST